MFNLAIIQGSLKHNFGSEVINVGSGGGLVAKSCPTLETSGTVARQAPLSVGFSRQEYWSGLPFPSPGYLPDSGIEPWFLTLQADSLMTELLFNHGQI